MSASWESAFLATSALLGEPLEATVASLGEAASLPRAEAGLSQRVIAAPARVSAVMGLGSGFGSRAARWRKALLGSALRHAAAGSAVPNSAEMASLSRQIIRFRMTVAKL